MERLSLHILSLLRLYDSVALPGIGVFNVNYVGARIDREASEFQPPRYDLSFVTGEGGFDSLLLDSYIRKEGISPAQAEALLEEDIETLKESLASTGEASIQGIGTFSAQDGALSFSAGFALNPNLPALPLPVVETQEEEPEVEAKALERVEVVPANYRYHDPAYYYIPVHKKLAKIAACFLLVIIVGLAAVLHIEPPKNSPAAASTLPIVVPEESPSKADTDKVATMETEAEADIDSAVTLLAEETDNEVVAEHDTPVATNYAIVAAFKTQKEAEKYIAEHPKDASHLEIIRNKRFYMISTSSSVDRSELDSRLPLIRAKYPDAWVYVE